MCSLFYIDETILQKIKPLVQERDKNSEKVEPGHDIRPTQHAWILEWNGKGICLSGMKWGYPGIQKTGVLINARAEIGSGKTDLFRWNPTSPGHYSGEIFL